jgi:hypothetical protein
MATTITELTNTDPAFYPTLGRYLANRDVHKFVGDNIWDDPHKNWLLLTDRDNGTLLGFCAVTPHNRGRWVLESLYTIDHDDRRTAARLVREAVKRYGHDRHLHAVVRHEHTHAYAKAGFQPVSELTNFTKLVRPATITKDTHA